MHVFFTQTLNVDTLIANTSVSCAITSAVKEKEVSEVQFLPSDEQRGPDKTTEIGALQRSAVGQCSCAPHCTQLSAVRQHWCAAYPPCIITIIIITHRCQYEVQGPHLMLQQEATPGRGSFCPYSHRCTHLHSVECVRNILRAEMWLFAS